MNFEGPVRVPENVGLGLARVTIRFDAWKAGNVAPSEHQVQVVRPRHRVILEEVSPRLKAELIHPDREAALAGIRFSPDGQRVIAGSYPKGIIQLWDAVGYVRCLQRLRNEFRKACS